MLELFLQHLMEVSKMDVLNAYFYSELSEYTYMEQPPDFVSDSNLVCRLRKVIYNLNVSLKLWNKTFD